MEFFHALRTDLDAQVLVRELTIDRLPHYCEHIDKVLSHQGDSGEIYCLWGQFSVHREAINGGVRFTLPGCPNALAWTVTTGLPPSPSMMVVHCTINRQEHDADFIESIEMFVEAWAEGLADLSIK